mmetsp:Transcript_19441/g.41897  ORF Transcript_19441/g.41897 Transcript_19441/m.41897 type:complete len:227 (+) Transcript_19441:435-1115(+)
MRQEAAAGRRNPAPHWSRLRPRPRCDDMQPHLLLQLVHRPLGSLERTARSQRGLRWCARHGNGSRGGKHTPRDPGLFSRHSTDCCCRRLCHCARPRLVLDVLAAPARHACCTTDRTVSWVRFAHCAQVAAVYGKRILRAPVALVLEACAIHSRFWARRFTARRPIGNECRLVSLCMQSQGVQGLSVAAGRAVESGRLCYTQQESFLTSLRSYRAGYTRVCDAGLGF